MMFVTRAVASATARIDCFMPRLLKRSAQPKQGSFSRRKRREDWSHSQSFRETCKCRAELREPWRVHSFVGFSLGSQNSAVHLYSSVSGVPTCFARSGLDCDASSHRFHRLQPTEFATR